MDGDYRQVEGSPEHFETAIFLLTTIIIAVENRIVCDAGLKASSIDSGLPIAYICSSVKYVVASDEHGTIEAPGITMRTGENLVLVPGHCDPMVNLHD